MSIKYAILGFLSWTPLTGYDLKKLFADSPILYWSGNNNQIYTTLVSLHREGLVSQEIEHDPDRPTRKRYSITPAGTAALREWVLSVPDLPELRSTFLIQLAWADQLAAPDLDGLVSRYEEEIRVKLLMLRVQVQPRALLPGRTPREAFLHDMITGRVIAFYEHELDWVRRLRDGLSPL